MTVPRAGELLGWGGVLLACIFLANRAALLSTQTVRPQVKETVACQDSPVFSTLYEKEPGGVARTAGGFRLASDAIIETVVCQPGQLRLQVRGEEGGGAWPILEVSVNSVPLLKTAVSSSRILEIPVPEKGRLTVAFLNDYYQADVRIAVLEKVTFKGEGCGTLHAELPASDPGKWLPATEEMYVVTAQPIALNLCSAGTMSFRLSGKPADGVYPTLQFLTGGKVQEFMTTRQPRTVNVVLDGSQTEVKLLNPYAKLIGDRNVDITGIQFKAGK